MVIAYLFQYNSELKSISESNIIAHNSEVKSYIDKYNRIVYEKESYIIQSNELRKLNDSLKTAIKGIKPITIVKYKTEIKYDTVEIVYDKPLSEKFTVPFAYNKQWLKLSGISSDTGIKLNELTIPNEQNIIVGMKKNGLFREDSTYVRVVNSNPYIKSSSLEGMIIKTNKNFFQRNKFIIGIGAGLVGGFILIK